MSDETNTIVLNIDRSIEIGKYYWSKLQEETKKIWTSSESYNVNSRPPLLGSSLLYYYSNKVDISNNSKLSEIICLLEPNQLNLVYDHRLLSQLLEAGFESPTDVKILENILDTSLVNEALDLIKLVWPAAFEEIKTYLAGFVIFDSEKVLSLTTPSWFGAIFLSTKILKMNSILEIATAIIHEIGHTVLFADSAMISPLEDLKEKFYSPLVSVERPALMVLHAQMAMARIVIWLNLVDSFSKRNLLENFQQKIGKEELTYEHKKYTDCYLETMPSVRQLALTPHGLDMLKNFEQIALLIGGANA